MLKQRNTPIHSTLRVQMLYLISLAKVLLNKFYVSIKVIIKGFHEVKYFSCSSWFMLTTQSS